MYNKYYFYEDEQPQPQQTQVSPKVITKNSVPQAFAGKTIKYTDSSGNYLPSVQLKNDIAKRAAKGRSITGRYLPTPK